MNSTSDFYPYARAVLQSPNIVKRRISGILGIGAKGAVNWIILISNPFERQT
jgi:hypothetical protein